MESLLEEDSSLPSKSGASKRKLKKDRRLKRQEQELEDEKQTGGEVTWDEDQELSLLTQMGWAVCMGSSCSACASAEQSVDDSPSSPVEPSAQLQMEVADLGAEEAEQARLKLQLSVEEWSNWEQQKDDLLEERQRMREQLKQRFEEFCERSGVGIFGRP